MSIAFGASNLGATAPSGYLQESSKDTTVEVATIRNEIGHTVVAQPKPRFQDVVNVKTKGEVNLLTVPVGDFSGLTLTSAKVGQTNDDFSTSEATYTAHY
jgi:hypothetical protein